MQDEKNKVVMVILNLRYRKISIFLSNIKIII